MGGEAEGGSDDVVATDVEMTKAEEVAEHSAGPSKPSRPQELVVDHAALVAVTARLVSATAGLSVDELERVFFTLSKAVYEARNDWDRTPLLKILNEMVDRVGHW